MAAEKDNLSVKKPDETTLSSFPIKSLENEQQADKTPAERTQHRANLKAYTIASQVAFVVVTPLLVFIFGGTWLVRKMQWPQWVNVAFIIIGILVMISSLISYLMQIIRLYDKDKKDNYRGVKTDSKDYDY